MSDDLLHRDELLGMAAELGLEVTPTQLTRWHRAGLVPRPVQRSLGRGRGTATMYPASTWAQLVALCDVRSTVRNLDLIGYRLWWDGFVVDAEVVRRTLKEAAGRFDAVGRDDAVRARRRMGPVEGVLRRRLGKDRLASMEHEVKARLARGEGLVPLFPISDDLPPRSLDDIVELLVRVGTMFFSQNSATELVNRATDDELESARDTARGMLAFLRQSAEPMAWLFGARGSLFRLIADMIDRLRTEDLPEFVVAILVFRRVMPEPIRALLAAPITLEPPVLLREIELVRALRQEIEGADEVFSPGAVRALLRGKEAARRHQARIERFVVEHQDEVGAVLDSLRRAEDVAGLPAAANMASAAKPPEPGTDGGFRR